MANVAKIKMKNVGLTTRRLKKVFENGVLPQLSEEILSDCNTYVRKQDGTLADSAHLERGGKDIVWSTKYAKKVYYTGIPRTNVNPNASLRWCEVAKRAHAKEWAKMGTKLQKEGKP